MDMTDDAAQVSAATPAVSASSRADGWSPLTRSQQLIWTGQQLSPGLPLYNMAWHFDLPGAIDPVCFQAAFEALINRGDALRSAFKTVDGEPRCRVSDVLAVGLEQLDLSREPDADGALAAWVAERATRPFDLAVAAFDSVLIRLGNARWCWFFNQHHISTDASSAALIHRRMGEFYRLALRGRLDQAPTLPLFADYLAHERGLDGSVERRAAQAHWQSRSGADSASGAATGLRLYGRRLARLSARPCAETRRLRALAAQDGVRTLSLPLTQFQLLATVFFAWLARVSGSRELTIGAPAHIRQSLAFRETIGLFIEMFPLRLELAPGETFRSLLA